MSSFLHNLILKGGGNTFRKNIALYKSPAWEKGILMLGQKPYYRLYPENDNFIKTAQINNTHLLIVNEKIIYEADDIFWYTIHVTTNKENHKTYADFLRYYY